MGHSIYLADDEKSIRELLHSFLASDGYTVRSFENGDALLEAFRQEPAELVILDIMMPGTDGLTVCRELRSVSDIPIILLTAKDSELDYVMGISQGSDDYLTKPFRPTILLMKVRALLRRVEITNLATNTTMAYTIVNPHEANVKEGKISIKSPIAEALLGRKVGDVVTAHVPCGVLRLRIEKITV